jgi:hypothetical protein
MPNSLSAANNQRRGLALNVTMSTKEKFASMTYNNVIGSKGLIDVINILGNKTPSPGEDYDKAISDLIIIRLLISGQIQFNMDVNKSWSSTIGKFNLMPSKGAKVSESDKKRFSKIGHELLQNAEGRQLHSMDLMRMSASFVTLLGMITASIHAVGMIVGVSLAPGNSGYLSHTNASKDYANASKAALAQEWNASQPNVNTRGIEATRLRELSESEWAAAGARYSAVVADAMGASGVASGLISLIITFMGLTASIKNEKYIYKKTLSSIIDLFIISTPLIRVRLFEDGYIPTIFKESIDTTGLYYSYINHLKRVLAEETAEAHERGLAPNANLPKPMKMNNFLKIGREGEEHVSNRPPASRGAWEGSDTSSDEDPGNRGVTFSNKTNEHVIDKNMNNNNAAAVVEARRGYSPPGFLNFSRPAANAKLNANWMLKHPKVSHMPEATRTAVYKPSALKKRGGSKTRKNRHHGKQTRKHRR